MVVINPYTKTVFCPNITISVLKIFKDILLTLSHSVRLFRSILMSLLRCFSDLLLFDGFMSSAKGRPCNSLWLD